MTEQTIENFKYVQFTYTIQDDSGMLLEQVDVPISYVHGAESGLIEKLEQALVGHKVGDKVSITLAPEEGFGPHRPELTYTDDIDNVPEQFRWVGAEVEMQNDSGEVKTFRVSEITNGKLTVDGNHPFAGRNLRFTVEVRNIRGATPEEIQQRRSTGGLLQ